jgi:TolA-binding protein|tara:strand:- start:427 stop:918 length:492 start_codon:yes stop_codon:yes gene_type:complete
MLLKILLLFGFVALPFGGCGQQSAEELFAAGEAAAADPASLDQAVGHFKDFLEKFDQDPKASEALNKLAALAQQQGQMQEAIAYYERVLADYPESGHGDEAQFMIAFIYEEYVRDVERARLAYQRVIDLYPNSELAASARHLLPNIGRNPEEWVEFQDRAPAQ